MRQWTGLSPLLINGWLPRMLLLLGVRLLRGMAGPWTRSGRSWRHGGWGRRLWTSVVNWLPVLLLLEVLLLLLVGGAPGWRVSVTRGNGGVARRGVGHRGTHHRLRRLLLLELMLLLYHSVW